MKRDVCMDRLIFVSNLADESDVKPPWYDKPADYRPPRFTGHHRDAAEMLVKAGLTIENSKGGYLSWREDLGFYHQTHYRSTQDRGSDFEAAWASFAAEAEIE